MVNWCRVLLTSLLSHTLFPSSPHPYSLSHAHLPSCCHSVLLSGMCFLSWTCTSCLLSNTLLPLHAFSFPCALLFPFLSHVKSFSLTSLLSHAFPPFSLFSSFLDFLLVDASSLWVMLSPSSLLPPSLLLCVLVPLAAFHTSSSFTSLTVCFPLCHMPLLLSWMFMSSLLNVHFLSLGCTLTPSLAFYLSLPCLHSFVCVIFLLHTLALSVALLFCCPPFLHWCTRHSVLLSSACTSSLTPTVNFLCSFPPSLSCCSFWSFIISTCFLFSLFFLSHPLCFPSLSHMLSCFSPSSPHSSPIVLSHFASL